MDYKNLNDYELIYQVRENDDIAYNTLINKYSNLVNMLAIKYMKNKPYNGLEKDDLYQAGMLGIIQALDCYNSENTVFYTYASLCAKREIERLLKFSSRKKYIPLNNAISFEKKISTDTKLTLSETISSNFNMEQEFIYREISRKLCELIYKLPIIDSSIFELKINGFNTREIGSLLDIPYGTVEYHLSKVKKIAKNVLR